MAFVTELYFLPQTSAVGRRIANLSWTHHPLGPPEAWPAPLQTSLATLLRAEQPMLLWWGESLFQFANDAYLQLQPEQVALDQIGQPAVLCWHGRKATSIPVTLSAAEQDETFCDLAALQRCLRAGALEEGEHGGHWTPIFDPNGQLVAGLSICNRATVTTRIQSEVTQVLEQMTDSFFVLDRDWTIVACNGRHESRTKIPRTKQLGRSFIDVFWSTPEGRKGDYYRKYKQVMQTKVPLSFVDYYEPLQMWTDCHVYPTAAGGIAVFCRDVTQTKQALANLAEEKQKLESIFAGSPTGMALIQGKELMVERCNAKYRQLIGDRDPVGRRMEEVFEELRGEPYFGIMRDVLATGRTYVAQEKLVALIVRRDGAPEDRYLDFTYTRINDSQGAPYGVYIHAKDVTEKVRGRMGLVDALRARDELLSICSHELKTPVASMKLSTQMFKRGLARQDPRTTSPERVARMVDQSDRQLDRLTRLIEEMLDFSRVSNGRLQLTPASCNLSALVQETLERLRPQLEATGAAATLNVIERAEGVWDSFRLEQLFTNLVTNAMKYGEGKPIHVALDQRADAVTLRVSDQGPGICVQDQERIFMPYERAVAVTSISGLGLGLYISRQIAEAHGGSIAVQSTPGAGATFVVDLPKRPQPAPLRKEQR